LSIAVIIISDGPSFLCVHFGLTFEQLIFRGQSCPDALQKKPSVCLKRWNRQMEGFALYWQRKLFDSHWA